MAEEKSGNAKNEKNEKNGNVKTEKIRKIKTRVEDMRENAPLGLYEFRNINAETLTEWVRLNHPETKNEYLALLTDKFNVFDKFKEVEEKPIGKKDEVRTLTFFEIREWVCKKYKMYPVKKQREESAGRKKLIETISRDNWENGPANNSQKEEE